MIDFSLMERIFPRLIQTHMTIGESASNRLKIERFFILIISTLLFTFSPIFSKSQISNQLVYETLVKQLVADHHRPFDSLLGVVTLGLDSALKKESSANCNLQVGPPRISWRKVGKRSYSREIEATILYTDSIGGEFLAVKSDTLAGRDIRKVRKSDLPELRGDDPRIVSKYIGPAALIGTLIAGIISLFYLRS